ncbi:MAG: alpha-E domain-containing protein [Chitinophagaceae bacterium]
MLSRIADSLFWLNRYTERSDSLLRLVYVHYILSLDRSLITNYSWKSVLELYSASGPDVFAAMENDTPAVLKNLLIDESNSNSIKSILNKARENARGAQDHITKEVWEVVNQMYHLTNQPSLSSKLNTDQAIKAIEAFSKYTALFTGITDNTMSRGLGWNFMNLGKFIERCMQTIAICNKQLELMSQREGSLNDILQWRYLLLALSGYEMHLKTYRSSEHTSNVLHQVTLNENFTRSVIYSLIRINYYLEHIMTIHEDQNQELIRSFGRLYSKVRYMDPQGMSLASLRQFLQQVQFELSEFGTQLGKYYFSYS